MHVDTIYYLLAILVFIIIVVGLGWGRCKCPRCGQVHIEDYPNGSSYCIMCGYWYDANGSQMGCEGIKQALYDDLKGDFDDTKEK